jgi:glyoxalase superfamily protein
VRVAVTLDCAAGDVPALSAFWSAALGYRALMPDYLVDPAGVQPRLVFNVVPEPKIVKNRVHLDLYVERLEDLDTKVAELVRLGATELHHVDEIVYGYSDVFTAMLDPCGNEFCVCAPHVRVDDGAQLPG